MFSQLTPSPSLGVNQMSMFDWFINLVNSPALQASWEYLPHILIAIGLGAGIGFERRHRHKVAGIRTHMVVCVSATIITLCGIYVTEAAKLGDPTRIAAQILPAIGFIGAGVIMKRGFTTTGITTAATVLFTCCIGIAVGFGFFMMSTLTSIILITLVNFSYWIFPSSDYGSHVVRIVCPEVKVHEVAKRFSREQTPPRFGQVSKKGELIEFRVHTELSTDELHKLLAAMVHETDVHEVELVDGQ